MVNWTNLSANKQSKIAIPADSEAVNVYGIPINIGTFTSNLQTQGYSQLLRVKHSISTRFMVQLSITQDQEGQEVLKMQIFACKTRWIFVFL